MIIVLGLFIMMMMCPKEKDHKDAICLAINQAVDEILYLQFDDLIGYITEKAVNYRI